MSLVVEVNKSYIQRMADLFEKGRAKTYPKNQLIQYQGDRLTHVYLIKKGYVKNYTILDSGDMRTLFILGPGDIFPIAFSQSMDWENYHLKYFYQSMTTTELMVMEARDFKHMIDTDRDKRNIYMTFVAAVNESIMNQLEAMKQKKAITRITHMLPYLIRKMGQEIRPTVYQLRIKLTHQELADLSGVTRETTTTLVKKLEKKGAIKQQKGKLVIFQKNLDKVDED